VCGIFVEKLNGFGHKTKRGPPNFGLNPGNFHRAQLFLFKSKKREKNITPKSFLCNPAPFPPKLYGHPTLVLRETFAPNGRPCPPKKETGNWSQSPKPGSKTGTPVNRIFNPDQAPGPEFPPSQFRKNAPLAKG